MWKPFRCRLFGEHDYQLRREPRALFLECKRCGHRSRGWNLTEPRTKPSGTGFRLLIAEPADEFRDAGAVATPQRSTRLTDADGLRLTFGPDTDCR